MREKDFQANKQLERKVLVLLSVNVVGPTDALWQCVWWATGEGSCGYCTAGTWVFLAASVHENCGKNFMSIKIAFPVYLFIGR